MNLAIFKLNKEGRPPYNPAILMKLYLYGYQNSIRSSRKLEKACSTDIEVMWLISDQRPHFKTIANGFEKIIQKPSNLYLDISLRFLKVGIWLMVKQSPLIHLRLELKIA